MTMDLSANIAEAIEKVTGGEAESPGDVTTEETEATLESALGLPPAAETTASPATPEPSAERDAKLALLNEKLQATRDARQRQREEAQARSLRAQAEADRKAAAEDRDRWSKLKSGNIKDTLIAAGRDPREVFEQMQEEARRATTPEGQLAAMREQFEAKLAEQAKELEQIRESAKASALREEQTRFDSELARALIGESKYQSLREEYDDAQVIAYANRVRQSLTNEGKSFNVLDVLEVLKSAQDKHEAEKAARRARFQATNPASAVQAATAQPTVNGTAERRNAGTLGNDLASSRASGEAPAQLTRQQRIQKLIDGGA